MSQVKGPESLPDWIRLLVPKGSDHWEGTQLTAFSHPDFEGRATCTGYLEITYVDVGESLRFVNLRCTSCGGEIQKDTVEIFRNQS